MRSHTPAPLVGRRRFIAAAAAAAAAGSGLMARPDAAAPGAAEERDLRVALIGAGRQGQELLAALAKLDGVAVAAVCDIWPYHLERIDRVVRRFTPQYEVYATVDELLGKEDALDAALVATPDFCHPAHTEACLRAGLHVYCESPMASTLEGAQRMIRAQRAAGKLLQIGYQRRSNPRYRHVQEKLLTQVRLLGRVLTATAQCNRAVQPDRGWPRRAPLADDVLAAHGFDSMHQFANWSWYRGLGTGPLGFLGSHQLDAITWMLGAQPVRIQASGGTDYYDPQTHQWPDSVMAALEFQTRAGTARAAYLLLNHNANLGSHERILGDEGSVVLAQEGGLAGVEREERVPDWDRWVSLGLLRRADTPKPAADDEDSDADGPRISVTETYKPTQYRLPELPEEAPCAPHLANFFDAVRGKAALACPAEAAYPAQVIVHAIIEAISSGATRQLTPEDFTV